MASKAQEGTQQGWQARETSPGAKPMTGAQRSFLDEKARQGGRPPVGDMTEHQAKESIDRELPDNGWGSRDAASQPHINGGEARRSP